ncbi:MAG: putative Ig domain-containing protein [Cyanobacteriota bacterium]|nr:putative Ig domain-containing protein [Cyanobacteriota bacterium]
MALSGSPNDSLGGPLSVVLEPYPFQAGPLSEPVLAATDPLQFPESAPPQHLKLESAAGTGLDWARLDAAVAGLSGQSGSSSVQGETAVDLAGYAALVDLDQLTGLVVSDDPAQLPSTLLEANLPPLLGEAFHADQLLVHKAPSDIDLLVSFEALRLGDGDDATVLQHGQPSSLWIDAGGGRDTALVLSPQAPLIDQWRGVDDLHWQPLDGAGAPLGAPSRLGAEHRFTVQEDRPFSLALADLFPRDGQLASLALQPLDGVDADWLQMEQRRPDATLEQCLLIESLFRDGQGNLLSREEIAALQPGSVVQADLVVSDTRAGGAGLIGLELDLQWDPAALNLLEVSIDPSLPLFRERGEHDALAGRLIGLAGAALPRAGSGAVLGDALQDLFASLTFAVGSAGAEGLNLQLRPTKLPTSGNQPLDAAQVLAVGSDPALIPVIHGLAGQAQVGERLLLAEGLYGDGRRWQQQLSLVVENVNDAPEALAAPPLTALEDQPLHLDLSAYFHDADLAVGDRLTFRLLDAQPDWLTLDPLSGLLSGDPSQAQVGSWQLQVEASDHSGATALQTITLRIDDVNDAPQWSGDLLPLTLLRWGREFSLALPADLFSDSDPGDSLSYSLDLEGRPDLASWLRIDPLSGVLTGVAPASDQLQSLDLDLNLIVSDRQGLRATTPLRLQMVDQTFNRSPYLVGELPQQRTVREGESLSFDLPALFRDDDRLIGDQLRFAVQVPDWLHFDPVSGRVSGLADNASVGTHTISFQALDRDGAMAVSTFQLTVENVNQAPERLAPPRQARVLESGSRFQLDLDAIFRDIDIRHGDGLSYTLRARSSSTLGMPHWLSWDAASGELSLSPGAEDRGLLSLDFSATDRSGLTSRYQLEIGIASADGLVEVNQALQSLRLRPGQASVLPIADAFLQLRGGKVDYSFELLRRGDDGSLTPLSADQAGWITLVDALAEPPPRSDRITVAPVLRLLETGELIRAEDLADLRAGTGVQLAISVADLRQATTSPGLIGLDLDLQWQGLSLAPDQPADLRQAISPLFPLFRRADLTGLDQQRLRFSAASLPAMGLGQALGDQPGETFLTLNFSLDDPRRPVRLDLTIPDEQQGGLGLGLADGGSAEGLLNLLDLSSTPLYELRLEPGLSQLGNYALALQAEASGGDGVSQILGLTVGSGENTAPVLTATPALLTFNDNSRERLPLDRLFRDADGDVLGYSLTFQGADADQERLLRDAIRVVYSGGRALLECAIPGLTKPIQAAMTLAAGDGLADVRHTVQLRLNPRSELVPLHTNPHHPSVRGGQLVGLADLFAAPPLVFADGRDSVDLDLRANQPLQLRLSQDFRRLAGLTAEEAVQLEESWRGDDGAGEGDLRRHRIPVSALAPLVSPWAAAFDLNWLELLAPPQPSSSVAIELATRSRVADDPEGRRFGLSQSAWERAVLLTRPAGAPDVVTPAVERRLADLLRQQGRRLEGMEDAADPARQGARALLAWRTQADFQAALEGTLEDASPVVMLKVRSSAERDVPGQAEALYQVQELTVLARDDDRFGGLAMDEGLEDGAVIAMTWGPLSFTVAKAADAEALADADPTRPGTQVVIELDVSGSGLLEGAFNAYRKFVAPETLAAAAQQGLVLRDLDGQPIARAGWYDFTQRLDADGRPRGDGARFEVETIAGERRLSRILLTLTDNGFGDNNLNLGVIDDPGAPVRIERPPVKAPLPVPGPVPGAAPTRIPLPNPPPLPGLIAPPAAVPLALPDPLPAAAGAGDAAVVLDPAPPVPVPVPLPVVALTPPPDPGPVPGAAPTRIPLPNPPPLPGLIAPPAAMPLALPDPLPAAQAGSDPSVASAPVGGSRGPRQGAPDPGNPLQSLFNQPLDTEAEPSTLVILIVGMMVIPTGSERGLRSLMTSGLGRTIQLQRRNPELAAEWPLRLPQPDGSALDLQLRLAQGRLTLLAQPLDQAPSPLLDDRQGGALWPLLGRISQPGAVIAQIEQRLAQLLHNPLDEVDPAWLAWLDQLRLQRLPNADPQVWDPLDQLSQAVADAQVLDPSLADALMALQLLDCHVRLGGRLPWLSAPGPLPTI